MRSPSVSTLLALVSLLVAAPASAQEPVPSLTAAVAASDTLTPETLELVVNVPERRPVALWPLYVSFGALQALDVHSTAGALGRGGVEMNPLVRPFAGSEVGVIALKAAGTAGVFYASERLWKKNKTAAVVFMVTANVAMGWVVQHNYRVAR
jgi:hypothetical protein